MPDMQELDYRSPEWVADQLGLEKNTVYKYLQDGVIPALQLGRKWLISETDLCAWLKEETSRQTKARRNASSSASHTARRMQNLTPEARDVIRSAHSHARGLNHGQLGELHILIAVAEERNPIAQVMAEAGLTVAKLQTRCVETMPTVEGVPARRLGRTPAAKASMRAANASAGGRKVSPADLVRAVIAGSGPGAAILKEHGITFNELETEEEGAAK